MAITPKVIEEGFARIGIRIRPYHVKTEKRYKQIDYTMRLGRRYNPLPTIEWLLKEDRAGRVAKGSLEGARYLLVGWVHELLDGGSACARVLDAETACVKAIRTAIVLNEKQPVCGVRDALVQCLKKLGIRFTQATDGRVRATRR